MATIVPGYDFTVNEVPKFDTVMAAAMGLGVTDLSITDVAEILIGVINGDVSNATGASLPTQSGWMWADPGGNTWLQTYKVDASGTTQLIPSLLFSATGGWYTNRWPVFWRPAPQDAPLCP